MKPLKSVNICFGFLLAGTGKSSWGHLHFSFTATTEDSPFFLSFDIYVSSAEKEHIETDVSVFLLMMFQAKPHLGSPPVPRVCNNEPTKVKAKWAWPFSLLGYFWQKCPGKCHVHVPTLWWPLAKQWSCESTAGMHSTHHHSDSPNPAVTAG